MQLHLQNFDKIQKIKMLYARHLAPVLGQDDILIVILPHKLTVMLTVVLNSL